MRWAYHSGMNLLYVVICNSKNCKKWKNFSQFVSAEKFQLEILFGRTVKDSPDPSHFIIAISVGKRRIRHGMTQNLDEFIFNPFWVDLEIHHGRCMSDPFLSDIYLKIKMDWIWTTLNSIREFWLKLRGCEIAIATRLRNSLKARYLRIIHKKSVTVVFQQFCQMRIYLKIFQFDHITHRSKKKWWNGLI